MPTGHTIYGGFGFFNIYIQFLWTLWCALSARTRSLAHCLFRLIYYNSKMHVLLLLHIPCAMIRYVETDTVFCAYFTFFFVVVALVRPFSVFRLIWCLCHVCFHIENYYVLHAILFVFLLFGSFDQCYLPLILQSKSKRVDFVALWIGFCFWDNQ